MIPLHFMFISPVIKTSSVAKKIPTTTKQRINYPLADFSHSRVRQWSSFKLLAPPMCSKMLFEIPHTA